MRSPPGERIEGADQTALTFHHCEPSCKSQALPATGPLSRCSPIYRHAPETKSGRHRRIGQAARPTRAPGSPVRPTFRMPLLTPGDRPAFAGPVQVVSRSSPATQSAAPSPLERHARRPYLAAAGNDACRSAPCQAAIAGRRLRRCQDGSAPRRSATTRHHPDHQYLIDHQHRAALDAHIDKRAARGFDATLA